MLNNWEKESFLPSQISLIFLREERALKEDTIKRRVKYPRK
jgi:hypothetical protein